MKSVVTFKLNARKSARLRALLIIVNMLMASRTTSLTRSAHPILKRTPIHRRFRCTPLQTTPRFAKSLPCPLWSSSFSLCHPKPAVTISITSSSRSISCFSASSMASTVQSDSLRENPLLEDFEFPPFDAVQASHVRPGIRALLQKLVSHGGVSSFLGFRGSDWLID